MIHRAVVVLLITLVLACSPLAKSQQPSNAPQKSVPFDWDYRKAEQVDYRHTIESAEDISSADKHALIELFAGQLADLMIPPEPEKLKALAETIPSKSIDLNSDGVPEIIAQAAGPYTGCSPTGNCPFWVLQREKNGYSVVLRGNAQMFHVQPHRTNGFHDIVVSLHESAFDSAVIEYRFDGSIYKEGECYNFRWGDGEKEFAQPEVTPCRP